MKLNLKKLVAKPTAKRIIETYEELGYEVTVDEEEWEDYSPCMTFVYKNKGGCIFVFSIPKEEFEEKKPLKPYVWYPVEEFDGNPNNYILLEAEGAGVLRCGLCNFGVNRLRERTSHFMYIERLKEL